MCKLNIQVERFRIRHPRGCPPGHYGIDPPVYY